jgi:hypothetical protein
MARASRQKLGDAVEWRSMVRMLSFMVHRERSAQSFCCDV